MLSAIRYPASTIMNSVAPAPLPAPAPALPWDIQEEWWGEVAILYCNGKKATVRNIEGFGSHFEITEDGNLLCEGIHPSLGAAQQAASAAIH